MPTLNDLLASASFPDSALNPDFLRAGLATPSLITQFARGNPDVSRRFIQANPSIVQAFATQFPDQVQTISDILFPQTPSPPPPPPTGTNNTATATSLVPQASGSSATQPATLAMPISAPPPPPPQAGPSGRLAGLLASASFPDSALNPDFLRAGLATPSLITQFARGNPDVSRRFIQANPSIVQAFATQFPDQVQTISDILFPQTPSPPPPPPGLPPRTPADFQGSLTQPFRFNTPTVSIPNIPVSSLDATPPTFEPLPQITAPTATIPPPPPVPDFGRLPDQRFQDLVKQFVTGVQSSGTEQVNRQLHEILLPELKASAAASGQISPEGAVSGPFLENLSRLGERGQRAIADVVKGAQSEGLGKLIDQSRFQAQTDLETYRSQLSDAVNRGQLSLGQADLALKVARANQDSVLQKNQFTLQSFDVQQRVQIEQLRANLQAQVAAGQISTAQAELSLNAAKAEADANLRQQALQVQLLDLLSGRQIQSASLGISAVQQADQQRLQELLALSGLGSQDIERLLQGVQAVRPGGFSQTQTESGNALRDVLGGGLGLAGIASLLHL